MKLLILFWRLSYDKTFSIIPKNTTFRCLESFSKKYILFSWLSTFSFNLFGWSCKLIIFFGTMPLFPSFSLKYYNQIQTWWQIGNRRYIKIYKCKVLLIVYTLVTNAKRFCKRALKIQYVRIKKNSFYWGQNENKF